MVLGAEVGVPLAPTTRASGSRLALGLAGAGGGRDSGAARAAGSNTTETKHRNCSSVGEQENRNGATNNPTSVPRLRETALVATFRSRVFVTYTR